jgi:hypothetical protein
MENCQRTNDCKSASPSNCTRCHMHSLFRAKPSAKIKQVSDKEGMHFQTKVQQKHKNITGEEGRQTFNSGAIWVDPGDVVFEHDLVECKERKLNARGEKSFTITKDILDKIDKEAGNSKAGIVAFGFKGDDEVYVIGEYDLWLTLIQQVKMLRKELQRYNGKV